MIFKCTGVDAYVGQPREWWVEAGSQAAALALVEAKGLRECVLAVASAADRPQAAPLYRESGPVERPTAARRRARLILLGMGLGLTAIAGFLFSVKASAHLGRGRPPIKQVSP